ncbi:outer membrane lipoprotein carrier protein LolA [Candidatus Riflebacteria bacterium]
MYSDSGFTKNSAESSKAIKLLNRLKAKALSIKSYEAQINQFVFKNPSRYYSTGRIVFTSGNLFQVRLVSLLYNQQLKIEIREISDGTEGITLTTTPFQTTKSGLNPDDSAYAPEVIYQNFLKEAVGFRVISKDEFPKQWPEKNSEVHGVLGKARKKDGKIGRIVLWIDKNSGFPVKSLLLDKNKGVLFEREFFNLKINPEPEESFFQLENFKKL